MNGWLWFALGWCACALFTTAFFAWTAPPPWETSGAPVGVPDEEQK